MPGPAFIAFFPNKMFYNTFSKAILILFLVIFEDDKNGNFHRDESFGTFKHTNSRQNQNQLRNVKILITSFQGVNKVITDIFINVINKVHAHLFVYPICNSLGNIFLYF